MSSEAKVTPGPWRRGPLRINSDGEGHTFQRGDVLIYPPNGFMGPVAVVAGDANAHIINAAPDLLEACRAALKLRLYQGDDYERFAVDVDRLLRSAVAKATGAAP